ncbi:MAG: (deoxy)nucleoside triphosphate pyrophosphohydrolase, partial [Legionellales bacterium]
MKVAVGIITDEKNHILVTQRPLHASHGGFWEFPGGKLEANETPENALIREIKEEVGLEIKDFRWLKEIDYQYPDRDIHLI